MVSILVSTVLWLTVFGNVSGQRVCLADIGFVVDESGSIRDTNPRGTVSGSPDDNWQKQIDFIHTIISGDGTNEGMNIAPDQTRVGLVTFSNNGKLHFDFNEHTNKDDLLFEVYTLPYRGGITNTTGGLMVAKDMLFSPEGGDRDYADDFLILLTDGEPTRWVDELFPYAAQLRDQYNIRIIGIGVTSAVNENTLREIVSPPFKDNYFYVADFGLLQTIVGNLTEKICPTQAQPTIAPPQPTIALPQPTTAPLPVGANGTRGETGTTGPTGDPGLSDIANIGGLNNNDTMLLLLILVGICLFSVMLVVVYLNWQLRVMKREMKLLKDNEKEQIVQAQVPIDNKLENNTIYLRNEPRTAEYSEITEQETEESSYERVTRPNETGETAPYISLTSREDSVAPVESSVTGTEDYVAPVESSVTGIEDYVALVESSVTGTEGYVAPVN